MLEEQPLVGFEYTVERHLSGYLLSGCPFIRAVEKGQFNTMVTLRYEGDIRKSN